MKADGERVWYRHALPELWIGNEEDGLNEMVKQADEALYSAKTANKEADAASGKGEGSLEDHGEYEYQGTAQGWTIKTWKGSLPEYLLKKELSEANEKMQEIINAIPGALPSIRYPTF